MLENNRITPPNNVVPNLHQQGKTYSSRTKQFILNLLQNCRISFRKVCCLEHLGPTRSLRFSKVRCYICTELHCAHWVTVVYLCRFSYFSIGENKERWRRNVPLCGARTLVFRLCFGSSNEELRLIPNDALGSKAKLSESYKDGSRCMRMNAIIL
jgi:hypothetical protein